MYVYDLYLYIYMSYTEHKINSQYLQPKHVLCLQQRFYMLDYVFTIYKYILHTSFILICIVQYVPIMPLRKSMYNVRILPMLKSM